MASSLAWLDFSEQEQRRVLSVVELFRDRDTVDELGVGVVRDTFSELLFPGTSTLHSRGRYAFFIPWTYQTIERSPAKRQDPWRHARVSEIRLIDALLESDDTEGTIGSVARATLKVFPSTVYWAALATWGVRLIPFSQDQYHRWLRGGGQRSSLSTPDGEDAEDGLTPWHQSVPPAPEDFPRRASFRFERQESEYLAERISMRLPGTLLAVLIDERAEVSDVEYPWDLPAFATLPAAITEQLAHASRFSLVINGAPLLYNLMLAEKAGRPDKDDLQEGFNERLSQWAAEVRERGRELENWDRAAFWDIVAEAGTRTPHPTRRFIDRWFQLTIDEDPSAIAVSETARGLIKARERAVKRGRARLHNPQALALWGGDAGTGRLVFRWPNAKLIVQDIVDGLRAGDA